MGGLGQCFHADLPQPDRARDKEQPSNSAGYQHAYAREVAPAGVTEDGLALGRVDRCAVSRDGGVADRFPVVRSAAIASEFSEFAQCFAGVQAAGDDQQQGGGGEVQQGLDIGKRDDEFAHAVHRPPQPEGCTCCGDQPACPRMTPMDQPQKGREKGDEEGRWSPLADIHAHAGCDCQCRSDDQEQDRACPPACGVEFGISWMADLAGIVHEVALRGASPAE